MNMICSKCKAVDSFTYPYGKTLPCKFHKNCSGMRKMKCYICGCKYGDKPFD